MKTCLCLSARATHYLISHEVENKRTNHLRGIKSFHQEIPGAYLTGCTLMCLCCKPFRPLWENNFTRAFWLLCILCYSVHIPSTCAAEKSSSSAFSMIYLISFPSCLWTRLLSPELFEVQRISQQCNSHILPTCTSTCSHYKS